MCAMKMKWFVIVLAMMPMLAIAQKLSDAEKEILMLQDQRSLRQGKLAAFLTDQNPRLRSKALIAFANIQDTSTISSVVPLLDDPDLSVRVAAAFALGQIGATKAQGALLARMRQERDSVVIGRIFEALGRVGDDAALDEVVGDSLHGSGAFVQAERNLAVARFALRGIKNERSLWYCLEQTTHRSAEVRWKALFALWRSAPHGLIDVEIAKRQEELSRLAQDPDVDVRVNLVTLLGRSKSGYAIDLLRSVQEYDQKNPHWLVGVQLTRATAALSVSQPELVNDLIAYLSASNDHVVIAALQSLGTLTKSVVLGSADTAQLKQTLLKLAATKNSSADLTRGEAFVELARFFPEEFTRKNYMGEKDISVREQTKALEALSFIPSGRSLSIMLKVLDDSNVRVAMAAWDFIRRFLTPSLIMTKIRAHDPDWVDAQQMLYRKTLNSLKRKDMAITHLVSSALADTAYFGIFKDTKLTDSVIIALNNAFVQLASPNDVEAMQAAVGAMGQIKDPRFVPTLEKALDDPDKTVAGGAAEALHQITGKDYSARVPQSTKALYRDYDWSALESLRASAKVTVQTSKGTFALQLLADDAPFTVLSFAKLVKKHFYDGLQFHRVVPNFVIQGGDPRGDGWGGPGYAIRSEFSLTRFGRGMVGIASSGKDTEGCQFFVTHVPTPHLDGRYTIFARVVNGQDVVDRIQVGDTIKTVTID